MATMVTASGGEAKGSELHPKGMDRQSLSQRNPSEVDGARAGSTSSRSPSIVPPADQACAVPGRAALLQPSYSTQQISSLVGTRSTKLETGPAPGTPPKTASECLCEVRSRHFPEKMAPNHPETITFSSNQENFSTSAQQRVQQGFSRERQVTNCFAQDVPPGQASLPETVPPPSAGVWGQPCSCLSWSGKLNAPNP